MKKLFLFLNLFFVLFIAGIGESFANKKYRYIKREHGVRFQGHIPMSINRGFSLQANFAGAYAYNWKGMMEFGPYFHLNSMFNGGFQINGWAGGLLGEYNFIKNRGKRKLIPSVGLTVGAVSNTQQPSPISTEPQLALGLHVSLKSFVAKRTAFITTLAYEARIPFSFQFHSMTHHPDISMGFSYYFDFY